MSDEKLKSLRFPGLSDRYVIDAMSDEAKEALLDCFENVAWVNENGQTYYNALYNALYDTTWQVTNNLTNCTSSNADTSVTKGTSYSATITAAAGYVMDGANVSITMGGTNVTNSVYSNGVISIPAVTGALVITISAAAKTVSSINAVYTQSGTVYTTDSLDSLKDDLVVTATYSDSSTDTVIDYTLSGTLTAGTSVITVTYGGETDTFNVTVTAFPWLYRILDTTINNNYIDTGINLSDSNKAFSIAFDVDITSATGKYRIVDGLENINPWHGILISKSSAGANKLNFRFYNQYKTSTNTFIIPGRVKLVATHEEGSSSMNVTYIGTTGTSTTVYTDTVTGTFSSKDTTIKLGGIDTDYQWIGTVHSFYLYNSVLTSAGIDNYLGVS